MFLRLTTTEELERRASRLAGPTAWIVVALLVIHVVWTRLAVGSGIIPNRGSWLALTFAVATARLTARPEHPGAAFGCSAATIAFTIIGFFAGLYPNLIVSNYWVFRQRVTRDDVSPEPCPVDS